LNTCHGLRYRPSCKQTNRSHTHTHTHRQRTTPPTPTHTHTHDKNNTPNPQTKTSHKHLTTALTCVRRGTLLTFAPLLYSSSPCAPLSVFQLAPGGFRVNPNPVCACACVFVCVWMCLCARASGEKINRSHTHTPRQRTTPPTPTHTHTRQEQDPKPPNEHLPQTLNNARRSGSFEAGARRVGWWCDAYSRYRQVRCSGILFLSPRKGSSFYRGLAWPHRRRGLASDGVRYADARSSCRPPVSKRYETNY